MSVTLIQRPFVPVTIDHGRFVLRCVIAASLSYFLASAVALPHSVWAPMSALIVSQESLSATRSSVFGRGAGTLIGAAIALLVHVIATRAGVGMTAQIAIAVALCAFIAKERPTLRVCLWTAPLVLITTTETAPVLTALYRTCEVVLGVVVGGAVHLAEDFVLIPFVTKVAASRSRAG